MVIFHTYVKLPEGMLKSVELDVAHLATERRKSLIRQWWQWQGSLRAWDGLNMFELLCLPLDAGYPQKFDSFL